MASVPSDRKQHARRLFSGISNDYDRWASLLSFGEYTRWHDRLVETLAPAVTSPRAHVADVATGTAAVAIAVTRRYGAQVTGFDQSPDMLAQGAERIAAAHLEHRIELVEAQAESLPLEDESMDALTHTYLLRYVDDPAATLAEMARVIRPGGIMASLEFGVPAGAFRPPWWLWTRAGLPTVGALAGPGWVETGRFLGPSIEGFYERYPLDAQLKMWSDAGMERIRARRLSQGGGIIIHGVRG